MRVRALSVLVVFALFLPAGAVRAQTPPTPFPGLHEDGEPLVFGKDPTEIDRWAKYSMRPIWGPLPMFRADTALIPALERVSSSKDEAQRARAAFLLGQIGSPRSVASLLKGLNDPSPAVRIHSGIALASVGDARGLSPCAAALRAQPDWVKVYAVYGLWRLNTPKSRQILKAGTSGQTKFVKSTIANALRMPFVRARARALPRGIKGISSKSKAPWQSICEGVSLQYGREADFWWHRGYYEQSIRCLEAAVFVMPEDIDKFSSIGWLYWNLGNDASAVDALKRGVAANPGSADAYYELGQHYFKTKRYDLAEEPLRKSVQLGGDNLAQRTYAHCLEKVGKLDQSLAQWNSLVKTRPNDIPAKKQRDRVQALVSRK